VRRAAVLLGLGLYALILVVAPLLEHDFDCCALAALVRLPEAGRVETLPEGTFHPDLRLNLPGRSPPA
jgi:hypothetical protein